MPPQAMVGSPPRFDKGEAMTADMNTIPPELAARAEQGDSDAQITLGRHFDAAGQVALARGWFARAAKAGRRDGLRELATSLLIRTPIVERDGLGMMQAAAREGDALAAYYWGLLTAEAQFEERWQVGIACLGDAAGRGLAVAREELELLAPNGATEFTAEAFASRLPLEFICREPRIAIIRNCLRPDLCDWLIRHNRDRSTRAPVHDPASGNHRIEYARSNSHVVCDLPNTSMVLTLLRARILASISPAAQPEVTTLLHYRPGEEFMPHYDFFDLSNPGSAREVAQKGQRSVTCLVYLNDDYQGGETEFLRVGLQHRGRKGDALVFWNLLADRRPDPLTYHAGRPTTVGEKWVVSQWLR